MNNEIEFYNNNSINIEKEICKMLYLVINNVLSEAESKIWHSHPVWFINGNPIVGYSIQKNGIRLMFWSGADFNEEKFISKGTKFKDASIFYTSISEINVLEITNWLKKSIEIQWDYKNLVKRKGKLERLII